MSVEPGIVDTNVLVYALDADAPQHAAARALVEAARADAPATLFVTAQILCEFYSIVTNPRRVPKLRTAAEAMAAISSLLAFLHVLPVPSYAVDGLLTCCADAMFYLGNRHEYFAATLLGRPYCRIMRL
jgi:predicted nucleic acid-binding protein